MYTIQHINAWGGKQTLFIPASVKSQKYTINNKHIREALLHFQQRTTETWIRCPVLHSVAKEGSYPIEAQN